MKSLKSIKEESQITPLTEKQLDVVKGAGTINLSLFKVGPMVLSLHK